MTPDRARCLETLARQILRIQRDHPVRVAIDGPDAAGKTTLADELAPLIERSGRPVTRASIDGFRRPRAERIARGHDSPEGYYRDSFDYPTLRAALLDPLGPGGSRRFRCRVFDYRTDAPVAAPTETAAPNSILIFDGGFLLRPELVGCWDFSVFVAVTFAEIQRRAVARDAGLFGSDEAAAHRYAVRYLPGQSLYFAEARPQETADLVLDNEDPGRPRLRAGGALG